MMRTIAFCCLAAAALSLFACSANQESKTSPAVTEDMSPAGPGSGQPELAGAPDGRVFTSGIEQEGARFKLLFSVRDSKGASSAPRMIASGEKWFVNYADPPSITVLPDGGLAAHWLVNNEPGS